MNNENTLIKCLGGYLLIIGVHKIVISEDTFVQLKNDIMAIQGRELEPAPAIIKKPRVIPAKPTTGRGKLEPGQWSRKYKKCVDCGTTEHRHKSLGYCIKCYRVAPSKETNKSGVDDFATSSAGKKYHCKECGNEFFSVLDYMDVRCGCGSKSLLTLK